MSSKTKTSNGLRVLAQGRKKGSGSGIITDFGNCWRMSSLVLQLKVERRERKSGRRLRRSDAAICVNATLNSSSCSRREGEKRWGRKDLCFAFRLHSNKHILRRLRIWRWSLLEVSGRSKAWNRRISRTNSWKARSTFIRSLAEHSR